MRKNGIITTLHYYPIHLHSFYKKKGFKLNDFPIAEALKQNFKRSKIYHVNDWKETFRILRDPRLTYNLEDSIL